jgi:uncharacterized membrane protein
VGVALASFILANRTHAGTATFTTIDYPDSVFTIAAGINSAGVIVGRYVDAAGIHHGFLFSGGAFTSLNIPGAEMTRPVGINDKDEIVGHYHFPGKKDLGFLLREGVYTTIQVPGAAETVAGSINANGEIAGYYRDAKGKWHGFVLINGEFTTIDYPRAKLTEVWRMNDSGQIVGRYAESNGDFHLFRLTNGQFESFDFPGAVETAPGAYSHLGGLNNLGDIVSAYASGSPFQNLANPKVYGNVHGLLLSGGVFTSIDPPGAVEAIAIGINDAGHIVGVYADATGRAHGFLRTLEE